MYFPCFPKMDCNPSVGVFAPSSGVGHKLESFDRSLEILENKGFTIYETASVRTDNIRSADASVRGRELNELVKKETLDILISASGGEFCFEMLEYIDFDSIREHPVWIAGASDPTSILYYITTALDIATIYGFNAGSFDGEPLHLFQQNALSVLAGSIPVQHSFDLYDSCRDFSRSEFITDADVFWYSSRDNISVSGRIIGGCIDVLAGVMGTCYDRTIDFIDRYEGDGIIWYFDPFDMTPEQLYLTMYRFKYAGYFRSTKLVIIGRVMFTNGRTDDEYEELLHRLFDELDIPFIFNADIGHVKPCMTIINGAMAAVECQDGKGRISQELK